MAGFEEVVFEGSPISDIGMVGAAEGDILVAGSGAFTFAVLTKGSDGDLLTAGASTVSWETPTVYAPATGSGQGSILVSGSGAFTYAELAKGTDGQVLTAGASTLSWTAAGAGDFKADGTVPMTAPLRLIANAGETGMGTVDGSIFYDTTANKLKVYVA